MLKRLSLYLKRLAELALAGGIAGAGSFVATNGLDLSGAGLRGLAVAAGMAAYGLVVRKVGEKDRPTVG
jgi:hypothetical protein